VADVAETTAPPFAHAAATFRVLGSAPRLDLLAEIAKAPASVNELIESTGQRLSTASRHLGEIRLAGLAVSVLSPAGRKRIYTLTRLGEKTLALALELERGR
jgi:DNA-binding transcriptional ArsR family regulator